MVQSAQSSYLPDGRLHLHHGPIDLIIRSWGIDQQKSYDQATQRFATVLDELVPEIAHLRAPITGQSKPPRGEIAVQMFRATSPHSDNFVTPMAAVAGAVADTICRAMVSGLNIDKVFVNNGGDIAVFLAPKTSLAATIPLKGSMGTVTMDAAHPARGLATSGWRGRSQSLGIADAVTVLAPTAAAADAAATLIANAVNLPDHPRISRIKAQDIAPDSDLGDLLVTINVGVLSPAETQKALAKGHRCAMQMQRRNLITCAALFLNNQNIVVGSFPSNLSQNGEHDARLQLA